MFFYASSSLLPPPSLPTTPPHPTPPRPTTPHNDKEGKRQRVDIFEGLQVARLGMGRARMGNLEAQTVSEALGYAHLTEPTDGADKEGKEAKEHKEDKKTTKKTKKAKPHNPTPGTQSCTRARSPGSLQMQPLGRASLICLCRLIEALEGRMENILCYRNHSPTRFA
jgi:hypothetical protein